MPTDDKLLLLLDKISEVSERTARMEVEQTHMKDDLAEIRRHDETQNKLLADHIEGTVSNRKRLEVEIKNRKDLEAAQAQLIKRVTKLEEPSKFLANLKKYAVYIAGLGGAIAAIVKLMNQ